MGERDLRIDLIKLIAAVMIVVLHTIENLGGGLQRSLYLMGTCGIPLFLTVNGYLLYNREISGRYICKKILQYLRFFLAWAVLIGTADSIVKRQFKFFDVMSGALIGKGLLYHFWFIPALVVILLICNTIHHFLQISVQDHMTKHTAAVIVMIMSGFFLLDIILSFLNRKTTRDLIPGPLSLHVTLGYFFLGMSLHRIKYPSQNVCVVVAIAGQIGICLLSCILPLSWASEYYPCILCITATLSIMIVCLNWRPTDSVFTRIVRWLSPTSVGIWVLHPLCLAVIRKTLTFLSVEYTLILRLTTLPLLLLVCAGASKAALKMKGVCKLFHI